MCGTDLLWSYTVGWMWIVGCRRFRLFLINVKCPKDCSVKGPSSMSYEERRNRSRADMRAVVRLCRWQFKLFSSIIIQKIRANHDWLLYKFIVPTVVWRGQVLIKNKIPLLNEIIYRGTTVGVFDHFDLIIQEYLY